MTSRIGVRDLKNRASELVREVHERDAEYIVTLRGQPVAVLKPLSDKNEQELKRAERQEALSKLDELAEQIASAWRSPKSAVKLLEEQRR
ncbi:MAG TPA: type II toxin-antitoxin system Phd/YefM family antitoxin [Thermoanaerobaculia bacterium]|jgi:prevent-host-death family protein|nr:type II toxin-antitoxin system Phd/YefM family antitoxin [Thermoanaerobaculia bacterium]